MKPRLQHSGLTLLLIFFLCTSSFASDPGTTGAAFLKIPVNGRAVALGGSFTGVTGDVSSLEYNPAGLTGLQRTDINATFIDHFEDASLQSFSLGFPFAFKDPPLYDSVDRDPFLKEKIHLGLQYRVFKDEDTARSNTGVELEKFDIRDQLIHLGVAYPISSRLGVGVAGKFINQKLQEASVSNKAVDAGMIYKFTSRFQVGLSALNIGSGKAYVEEKDDLPTTIRAGAAYYIGRFLAVADLAHGTDKILRESAGVEFSINPYIKLRGGAFHHTDLEFSGGLGIQFTGPQKAPTSSLRKSQKQGDADANHNAVVQAMLRQTALKLTQQFEDRELPMAKPVISIPVFNSAQPQVGQNFSGMLSQEFSALGKFKVVQGDAPLLLLGSVEKTTEKYIIKTQIMLVENSDILARDYLEIATEDYMLERPAGNRMGKIKKATISNSKPNASNAPNIDIGLDYGFQTHQELGLTHTVSIRILY